MCVYFFATFLQFGIFFHHFDPFKKPLSQALLASPSPIHHTAQYSTSHQRCVVFVDRWRRRLEWHCSCQSGWQTSGAGGPGRAGLSKVLADSWWLRRRRGRLHVGGRRWRLQRWALEISHFLPPQEAGSLLDKFYWAADLETCPVAASIFSDTLSLQQR